MVLEQTDDAKSPMSRHKQSPSTKLLWGKQAVLLHKLDDYDHFWPSWLILAGDLQVAANLW